MKKKKLIMLLTIIAIICGTAVVSLADSGWDYDYDSGWDSDYDSGWSSSSWDSDYDSGWSSSSWDSDYDSDWGSSSSGSSAEIPVVAIFLYLLFLACITYAIVKFKNKRFTHRSNNNRHYVKVKNKNMHKIREISYEKLTQFPEIYRTDFLQNAYNNYVKLQKAWSNFDYNTLSKLTTNEMFNTYKMQLETLELKKQKNIMSDFEKHYLVIKDIKKLKDKMVVEVVLGVKQRDYVIDLTTNNVIRGDSNVICDVFYQLTFVSYKVNEQTDEKCPNCGAPISDLKLQRCEYCNSVLASNASDSWLLAKKQILSQHIY